MAGQNAGGHLAIVSQMMRRILVDHARARLAAKRSGRWARVTMGDADDVAMSATQIDLLDLDAALEQLAAFDARKSRIAELRFFGGLSLAERASCWTCRPRPSSATGSWLARGCSRRCQDNRSVAMPERWDALDRVWHAVLERPEPERAAAIDELCAEDHLRVSCEHHRGATLHPH